MTTKDTQMKIKLDESIQINGEGKLLYIVTSVDAEDPEDTNTELWRADDEDQLEETFKDDCLGDDPDDMMLEIFEEKMGIEIMFKLVGEIM